MEARARRGAAAIGLAALVVAAIGVFYLQPWRVFAPPSATPPPPPRSPARRPPMLQQVRFVSPNVGWVVMGGPASASLFRTTDAGRHWQHQLDGVAGDGWTLSFFDVSRGVVYGADQRGAVLWRTTDGGQHWKRTAMPCRAPPFLVSFSDLDHGWCVAPGSSLGPTSPVPFLPDRQLISLYRTADGGAHWSMVLSTDEARPVSGGLGDDGQKAWIWFRDADAGWIGQRSQSGTPALYATTDGGDLWTRQELPPPAGGWGPNLGTWEEGPQSPGSQVSPWLTVMEFRTGPQAGLLTVIGRYLYLWRSAAWSGPLALPDAGLPSVDEADQAHWFMAIGSSVQETTDAGANWSVLGRVPAGWTITRLTMSNRDRGWAALVSSVPPGPYLAPATALCRTVDGGRHWALVTTPS